MLTRGTASHDAEQISHLIEKLSGSLGAQAGRNSVGLRGEFLSRHFDRAFALFADCLLNPAFPEVEFERERTLLFQDIIAREDNPAGMAHDLLSRIFYQRHPYRLPSFGQLKSVEKITPGALRDYHRRYLNPAQMTLCVVGDVKADRVLAIAQDLFGKPGGRGAPPPEIAVEPPFAQPRSGKKVLNRAQSHLLLGFPGARVTDPWRHALELLSTVLSGQGGRLFIELRDKRSMAYTVSSFSLEGLDPGYFAVYIATGPPKINAALEGIRVELARVRDERISTPELRRAQNHLIGSHEIGLQRNGARAALLALDQCYGLGLDNFLHYAERISSITAEQVQEAAYRVIDFDRSALAVVGP
jgi:zinc protease